MTQKPLALRGCTPEPLGNYLKALGIFRLIAEQADSQVRGWWKDGCLWIYTKLSSQELCDFFLTGTGTSESTVYSPSPIFAPWGGRPGFYKDGNKEAKSRLAKILWHSRNCKRFVPAAITIRAIRADLRNRRWLTTKPKKEKTQQIISARTFWPRNALGWFDACLAIEQDAKFGFLLGTGGNEGSADITNNFWELIEEVIGLPTPKSSAEEMLRSALFGTVRMAGTARTAGQHFPASAGSTNSGQNFVGSTSTNPWDVILMLEGCILFSGATTKRLSQYGKGKAAFPFMLDHLSVGSVQTSIKEERRRDANIDKCRAEFWMPLWRNPATLSEINSLLGEGRLQRAGGDPAKHSLQAMEAIAGLGISKGIQAFKRIGLFERRGKGYYLAANLDDYSVPHAPNTMLHLIDELDKLREQAYQNLREGAGVPNRILVARQKMNKSFSAFLNNYIKNSRIESDDLIKILLSVSMLEQEVSSLKDRKRMNPSPGLSQEWNQFGRKTIEGRLAIAISSITQWGQKEDRDGSTVGTMRSNLLPVLRSGNAWKWDGNSHADVWSRSASLMDNMTAVLRRRLIDAKKGKEKGLPLWSCYGANFSDLLAFWNGECDENRFADLIQAFALVDSGNWSSDRITGWQGKHDPTPNLHNSGVWFDAAGEARVALEVPAWQDRSLLGGNSKQANEELLCAFELPRIYALLKLCFVGGRLPARPVERHSVKRIGSEPYPPSVSEILNLLQSGRISDAVEIALRKLHAKGYPAIFEKHCNAVSEIIMSHDECRRLAAMMLIPVRNAGVLAALAIKPINADKKER